MYFLIQQVDCRYGCDTFCPNHDKPNGVGTQPNWKYIYKQTAEKKASQDRNRHGLPDLFDGLEIVGREHI